MSHKITKYPSVAVVIPVYNETEIICHNVTRVIWYMEKKKREGLFKKYRLYLVDDSSTDGSAQKIKYLEQTYPTVLGVFFECGPSRRENVAQVLRTVVEDVVICMDCDLSTSLIAIDNALSKMRFVDIVIGDKYNSLSVVKRSWHRRFLSVVSNKIFRVVFRTGIMDHCAGFKVYRREVIKHLVNDHLGYDGRFVRGIMWDLEMLLCAIDHKYTIYQIPVHWEAGPKTTLRLGRELRFIPYLIKLYFRRLRHG